MNVAFRTDASPVIGTGHVMRCLALASALREKGAECLFIHRRHEGHLADYIEAQGFAVRALPEPEIAPARGNHATWLGVDPETDAAQTLEALGDTHPDWLVVDHYGIGAQWEHAVREKAAAVAVIDDLADRLHDGHILIDQNYCEHPESRYARLVPDYTRCLVGPRYALLRPEFRQARGEPKAGPVRRVFVSFGGSDVGDLPGAALAALEQPAFEHVAVDMVVAAGYPYREELQRRANLRPATIVHDPQPHLADLMHRADIAIGAGGTTTWERCALGLPAIVIAVADNQVELSRALDEVGAIWFLGHHGELAAPEEAIELALDTLCNDDHTRESMATAAWRMTDGFGAGRIAEVISPTPAERFRMRRAESRDVALFHDWASDPVTRANAFHPEPIPWDDHVHWFEQRLADPSTALLVMETPYGLPVGQARLERADDGVLLSYSIDPACRGRGLSPRLLELAIAQWHECWPDKPLHAETKPDNEASARALQRAGFVEQHRAADRIRFRYSAPLPFKSSTHGTTEMPPIHIAQRAIGPDAPPFVIAEMSGNHNGSLDRALALVDAAAEAGVHALKLQTYTADTMTLDADSDDFLITAEDNPWTGRRLYELYQEAHTPWEWHAPIFERAKARGLIAFSTPFDDTAVDFLEALDAPAYKIASFENNHLPLIRRVAATGKPLIISTGMATLDEIETAASTARAAGCEQLILLKCTSSYPAPAAGSNLATIPHMAQQFDCQVGLSDHTPGIGAAVAAVALGATVIEKHFTLDREEGGVDADFSLEPAELKQLVVETERAWRAVGEVAYGAGEAEKNARAFRRSLYFVRDCPAGHVVTADDVRIIRPGYGLEPAELEQIIGLPLATEVRHGEAVRWNHFESPG